MKQEDSFVEVFLAPKINHWLTISEFGIIQQHMTLKGFNDSKRILDRSQDFDMLEGKKISVMLLKSRKKSFNNGFVLPVKMKPFIECKGKKYIQYVIIKLTKTKDLFESFKTRSS